MAIDDPSLRKVDNHKCQNTVLRALRHENTNIIMLSVVLGIFLLYRKLYLQVQQKK